QPLHGGSNRRLQRNHAPWSEVTEIGENRHKIIQTLDSIGLTAGAAPGLMFESKAQKARREECRPFGAQILSQSYPGLTPLGSASCGSWSLHDDCGMLPSLLHPTKRKLCSSGGGGGNRTTSICSSSQRPEGPTEAEPSGASPGKMWRFDMSPGGRAHPAIVIKQQ